MATSLQSASRFSVPGTIPRLQEAYITVTIVLGILLILGGASVFDRLVDKKKRDARDAVVATFLDDPLLFLVHTKDRSYLPLPYDFSEHGVVERVLEKKRHYSYYARRESLMMEILGLFEREHPDLKVTGWRWAEPPFRPGIWIEHSAKNEKLDLAVGPKE